MPRIPTYQSRINAPGAQRSTRLQPQQEITNLNVPLVQDTTGERTQMIGSALGNAAMILKQKEDRDGKLRAMEKSSQLEVDFTDFMRQKELEATGSATGFTQKIAEDFDSRYEDLIGNASNQAEKLALRESQIRSRKTFLSQAQAFEYAKGLEFIQGSLTKTGENFNTQVYQDPNLFGVKSAEFQELIDSQDLPEGTKQKMKDQYINAMGYSAGMRMAEFSPDTVVEQTKQGQELPAWARALDPKQVQAIRNKAQTRVKTQEGVSKQLIRDTYSEELNAYKSGKIDSQFQVSKKELEYALGDKELAERKYEDLQQWKMFAEASEDISNDSMQELTEKAKAYSTEEPETQAGRARLQMKYKAIADRRDKLFTAPAETVLSENPSVMGMYEQFMDSLATGDSIPLKASSFFKEMQSEQERLGVPVKKILPQSYVNQIRANFSPTIPPEMQAQNIKALKNTWGENWGTVFPEIADKLPDDAYLMAKISNPVAQEILANLDSNKLQQLRKENPKISEIDEYYKTNETYNNLRQSYFQQSIGGPDVMLKYQNGVMKVASALMGADSNLSADKALERAVNLVIDSDYQFLEWNAIPIRVPRVFNGKKYNTGNINRGFESARDSLFTRKDYYLTSSSGNLTEEEQLQKVIGAIRNGVTFVTASDDSGVYAKVQDAEGNYQYLRTLDKKPIFFTWDDLVEMSINNPKPTKDEMKSTIKTIPRDLQIPAYRMGF